MGVNGVGELGWDDRERARQAERSREDGELLKQAAEALMNCTKAALTVKPNLTEPYRDDPRWSPWTRCMERRAREAHDLSMTIRKHLRDTGRNR